MKRAISLLLALALVWASGCATGETPAASQAASASSGRAAAADSEPADVSDEEPTSETVSSQAGVVASAITKHEEGFSSASWRGDYGFDAFLAQGGAKNDAEMVAFLSRYMAANDLNFSLGGACSAFQAKSANGYLFGRNFD